MSEELSGVVRAEGELFSRVSWELARRAKFRAAPSRGVLAEIEVAGGWVISGEGRTTTAAARDLAEQLERWGGGLS